MVTTTTFLNFCVTREFERLLESLNLEMEVGGGEGIQIFPGKHYPGYAERGVVGTFETFEEALAFLKGWAAHQDYTRLKT